ncbi:TrbC/VirB2 family protein [Paenalcaligenes sp.]|uniref:TrbC/VirB2 family protein n=1 Tax=Paenalcaligenes sp. TaxID=1966342 RepID=UPI00261C6B76|nr:TrbC/VirB2 family protein [Paenalcaligenes sp.]
MKLVSKLKMAWMVFMGQLFMAQVALAQVGGFANQAKSMMENIRDGIVIIVGVVATIALLWQLAEGFMGRKTWGDVLNAGLWIFGAGAAVAAATWVFTAGQGISF